MNFWRILGIGGAAFCTAALAATAAGAALNSPLNWKFAIFTAALNAGLATFQEIQKEADNGLGDLPTLKTFLGGVMLI